MGKIFVYSAFCLILSFSLFGQQPNFEFNKGSICKRLTTDIYILASDSFMGRKSGTKGEQLARDYIITKFKEAGIKPLFGDTTYIQPFNLLQKYICTYEKNYFSSNYVRYYLYTDFSPVIYSSNDSVSGEMCYVKFGITAPTLNYDDYKDKTDLKGKIFIIELSIPGGYKKRSEFMAYSSMSYKIDLAIKNGAKGIIFINSDKKYPFEPVKLLPGFKKYPLPVIYFNKKLEVICPKSSSSNKAIIQTEIESDNAGIAYNVAGFINNNASSTIVIGGHYDHLGFGGSGSLSPNSNQIHNGADDNASGTAGVVELARFLKNSDLKKYNFILITFSGEEEGLKGSEYFVKSAEFRKYKFNYMINLDMIGRMDSSTKKVELWATGSSKKWKELIKNEPATSFAIKCVKGSIRDSDHYPFYKNRVPTLFFNTGLHPDYHTPRDKANKINYSGETEIIVYLEKLIKVLDSNDKLKFRKTGAIANSRATIYMISEMIRNINTRK